MEQGYTTMSSSSRASDNVFLNANSQVASYTNGDQTNINGNSYLTPTSPIVPEPPHIRPPGHTLFFPERRLPNGAPSAVQRVDSGIDTGSQSSPTPSTGTVGPSNPRNSVAVYEYINPKDVYLEPNPTPSVRSRYNGAGESASSGPTTRTGTSTMDVTSDSDDAAAGFSEDPTRRRFNPMYEALEKSATRLYAQTCHCKIQSTIQKQIRYLWCALITVILIMIFTLGVIAYMLFFLVPGIQNRVVYQEEQIRMLQGKFDSYDQPEAGASQVAVKNISGPKDQYDGNVLGAITQLNESVYSLSSQLFAMNATFQNQLTNISLTSGPQGPAGAGNLSGCFYMTRASSQALPGLYSTTSWQPPEEMLEDYIVMSATCAVTGGNTQFVEADAKTDNKVLFRCRCDGQISGYTQRECRIHLILCPRKS